MSYEEDDMLMISGIQHFAFCPRQWALIHIDQMWEDNYLTAEGQIMHHNVDDSYYRQKMGDIICLRSINIASKTLGLYGLTDIVELYPTESRVNAITHPKYSGYWSPYPVEYKHGKPKMDNIDTVQLAAQMMCLEEQYDIRISEGAIFYGEIRRRVIVELSDTLRNEVVALADHMHKVYSSTVVPSAEYMPRCKKCSLNDICMPRKANKVSATSYLIQNLYEEVT